MWLYKRIRVITPHDEIPPLNLLWYSRINMQKKPDRKGTKKNGAPTKWTPELNEKLIDFFAVEPTERVVVACMTYKDGSEREEYKTIVRKLPFFSSFERANNLSVGMLSRWASEEAKAIENEEPEKYPGFFQAYKLAKELQKEFLIQNGLAGHYNATAFIFTAKNLTDMRDMNDNRFVDKDGNDRELGIIMYPAKRDVPKAA